jgi:DNA polymerase I
MPKKLFLVDGSNQAYRAYHAIQTDMRAPDGFPTRALYGFVRMLLKMFREGRPDFVAVTFDKGKGWRHERFPAYKAKRLDMPEDLQKQWPELCPLVEAFGYRAIMEEGAEADDLLGTLALQHASDDLHVFIVSGDKDFSQIVSDKIRILDLQRDQDIGPAEVQEKWGVPPEKMIDLLALMGDSSDNIQGVPGVGPKKAAQYIQKYGSLEAVLEHTKDIGGKTGEAILAHKDAVLLARELVTIHREDKYERALADFVPRPPDRPTLATKLTRFDFQLLLQDLELEPDHAAAAEVRPTRGPVEVVARYETPDPKALKDVIKAARAEGRVGLIVLPGDPGAVGLSVDPYFGEATGFGFPATPPVLEALAPLLADPAVGKVTHDAKAVHHWLAGRGLALANVTGDTMLLDYVQAVDKRHTLEDIALRYLGTPLGGGEDQGVLFADRRRLAAQSAQIVLLVEDNAELEDAARVYREIEIPLVPILLDMERTGIKVDVPALQALSTEFEARMNEKVQAIWKVAGEEFNVNSTQQLAQVLFEKRGHEGGKKTKFGWSTDSGTLEDLAGGDDPLPGLVLEYRAVQKLKSTYVDALPLAVGSDGRVHTTFHQAVAVTGRLSSNEPNLQNIPARMPEGRRIRACFVPEPGNVFLSADYSQIELRVLAHFCGDGPLVEAFRRGEDIHARTAREIFHLGPDDAITHAQRTASKAINFGLIYGMSAFRLSNDLGISKAEATDYITRYFDRYPQTRGYMSGSIADARRRGYSVTRFGRRRAVENLTSKNRVERGAAERIAMNSPIQGTAADIIKRAMVLVHARLAAEVPAAKLLLQVHDELLFEAPKEDAERVRQLVQEEMRNADELIVPLVVETGIAASWDAAH